MSNVSPTSGQPPAPPEAQGGGALAPTETSPSASGWWANRSPRVKAVVVSLAGAAVTATGLIAPNVASGSGNLDTINGCILEGRAKPDTWQLRANPLKNRWDLPSGETLNASVSFTSLISAITAPDAGNAPFTADHVAQGKGSDGTTFDEGQSAEISGYIVEVKVGGNESCNCNTADEQYMDTHIYIAHDLGVTDKSKCLIVEVTPRIRALKAQQGVDWSTPTLISTLKVGTPVQVSGWLFDDWEHRANSAIDPGHSSNVWRGSCWEIHPVTDIQAAGAPNDATKAANHLSSDLSNSKTVVRGGFGGASHSANSSTRPGKGDQAHASKANTP